MIDEIDAIQNTDIKTRRDPLIYEKSASPTKKTEVPEKVPQSDIPDSKTGARENIDLSEADIAHVVAKVREFVHSMNTKLSFSYDRESNTPLIYVIDKETNRVIRQIPPDEIIKIIRKMDEIRGIIFQGNA